MSRKKGSRRRTSTKRRMDKINIKTKPNVPSVLDYLPLDTVSFDSAQQILLHRVAKQSWE